MAKIIGIDLGATNSVIAIMESGDVTVIPNTEGGRTTPSVVAFDKNGERLVGTTAKRQAIVNPENTFFSINRLMGRRYDDSEIRRIMKMVSYEIVEGPHDDARVYAPVVDKIFTPQEIIAMILSKLKKDTEAYLGWPITAAVITAPASFDYSQRQALKEAGQIAGLEIKRVITASTASGLAYGLDKKKDETILVFDLGGGTLDVSVLEVGDGVFEVKSTAGTSHLGGDDWDECIVEWMMEEFKRDQDIDLSKDRQALQRLREAAEKAKIELSCVKETEINLPFITADASGPKHLQMNLTRSKFEQLTEDLVQRCRGPFEQALRDAGLRTGDLDEVILVGGSTHMPMIQHLMRQLMGKEPNKSVKPDEVVAIGAAIQAGVLAGEVKDVLLLDVTPLSLGVETLGGVMTVLIPRNTTIPTRRTEIFSTAADNQIAVDINVLQGEQPLAKDNKLLGTFRLDGIPPAPRGVPQIEVTFAIAPNETFYVSAKDKLSDNELNVNLVVSTNIDEEELAQIILEAKARESEYAERSKRDDLQGSAEATIQAAEKLLEEFGNKITITDKNEIEEIITTLKTALAGKRHSIQLVMDLLQKKLAEVWGEVDSFSRNNPKGKKES